MKQKKKKRESVYPRFSFTAAHASRRRSICHAAFAGLVDGSFTISLPVIGYAYF